MVAFMQETKVFWLVTKYDQETDDYVDEFLHDEVQNSILDQLEGMGINPTTIDMVELELDEYKNFELQEDELLFVYGPVPVNKHPKNRTFIPKRIAFDVMFAYESGTTILDHEHPADGWQERSMNDQETDEYVNNL
jgi:hypothetical protein